MSSAKDYEDIVQGIYDMPWDLRDGTTIPETQDVKLSGGAVKLEAAFLYADMAGSSKLTRFCPWQTTAKIIRAYLECATRLIRESGGEIRSFDGDRVMGVFIGPYKNSHAVTCARQLDWVVEMVLGPKAKEKFKSISSNEIKITHCVGVDVGDTTAVRAGIRGSNDLIWIGRAPSLAAKLSDVREYPYTVMVSKDVYSAMWDSLKLDANRNNVWQYKDFDFAGETLTIYRTKHTMSL